MPPLSTLFPGLALGLLLGLSIGALLLYRRARLIRRALTRAAAAERMAEIGAMTGGLAHEIKNPLSTIGLNAHLLAEAIDDSDLPQADKAPLLARVDSLRRETDRLRGILSDFLEFAGQVRLDRKPESINALLTQLCEFFIPEATRLNIRIRLDLTDADTTASVDAPRLKQALLNLMLNAVQAMAPGGNPAPAPGELILRTRRGGEGRVPVLRIHVIDTGPGIAPEVRARIFDPYFTTKAGGSGLGLPTTRRLIEAHHARLDVHSERGKGSDFCITLMLE
ncbi:HAMP domain-containing sensor histidine kinase [soil metagenome]